MNFDLDTDNYSKEDYFDFFDLDRNIHPTRETIEDKHKTLLNNIDEENIDREEKEKMKLFLTECKNNLLTMLGEDKYKLIETDFTPNLDNSETFQNNNNFVIKKKENPSNFHTNKINPFAKQTKTQLLNINTKFRKEYYNTNATNFILDLPEEFKNVISLTVQSVQIPNSNYTFSSSMGTNEFSIELFDLNASGDVISGSQIKK